MKTLFIGATLGLLGVLTSTSCAPDSALLTETEEQRALPIHNPLLRAEIARALTYQHPDLRGSTMVRIFPENATKRIIGSVGKTVEPDEVRDIEHLFQRMYFEDYPSHQWGGANLYPYVLGSLVTVGILGEPGEGVSYATHPQPSRLPAEGEPLSEEILREALEGGGCYTLRPDIVLWALHQRDVAAANNRAIRDVPWGEVFPNVKGFFFRPRHHGKYDDTEISWKDDSTMVKYALDYSYPADSAPPGERFELGEIGGVNEISAAELGYYLTIPGIRKLRTFAEIKASNDVPSPPPTVWHNLLNPGRLMGQRLRHLSALLDRLDADGTIAAEALWQKKRNHPEMETKRFELTLTREKFLKGLPELIFRSMRTDDGFGDFGGRLFVDGNQPCGAEPSCPVTVDYFANYKLQRERRWFRPELRLLEPQSNAQMFVPFGRFLLYEVWNTWKGDEDLSGWYEAQHFNIEPVDTDPLALVLPEGSDPDPQWVMHVANVNGHSYDVYNAELFRDGFSVTPYSFGLGQTVWSVGHKDQPDEGIIGFDNRIYFMPRLAEPWQKGRGTLVYDMNTDTWLHGPYFDIVGWFTNTLKMEGTVLMGLMDPGPTWQSIDLATWALEPADPAYEVPSGPRFPNCSHSLCVTGEPLTPTCNPPKGTSACPADICQIDPYCCEVEWDEVCVDEVIGHCSSGLCQ
jgi:hypothetical protein